MKKEEAKQIIQDFISETPDWLIAMKECNQCIMCGMKPESMNDLRNALITLKVLS